MGVMLGTDGDQIEEYSIGFKEFVLLMHNMVSAPEVDEDVYNVYKVFDRDDKGIDCYELARVMNKILDMEEDHALKNNNNSGFQDDDDDDKLKEGMRKKKKTFRVQVEDVAALIEENDIDGNGKLSIEEFSKLLTELPSER